MENIHMNDIEEEEEEEEEALLKTFQTVSSFQTGVGGLYFHPS